MKRVAVFVVAITVTGCATLTAPQTARYRVNSSPEGASVLVDGLPAGETPTSVELVRAVPSVVEVHSPAYGTYVCPIRRSAGTGYVVADTVMCVLLFPFGCIAFIDAGGAWNEIDTPTCSAQFAPASEVPAVVPLLPPPPPPIPPPL